MVLHGGGGSNRRVFGALNAVEYTRLVAVAAPQEMGLGCLRLGRALSGHAVCQERRWEYLPRPGAMRRSVQVLYSMLYGTFFRPY